MIILQQQNFHCNTKFSKKILCNCCYYIEKTIVDNSKSKILCIKHQPALTNFACRMYCSLTKTNNCQIERSIREQGLATPLLKSLRCLYVCNRQYSPNSVCYKYTIFAQQCMLHIYNLCPVVYVCHKYTIFAQQCT